MLAHEPICRRAPGGNHFFACSYRLDERLLSRLHAEHAVSPVVLSSLSAGALHQAV